MRVLSIALAFLSADVAVAAALCRPASTTAAVPTTSTTTLETSSLSFASEAATLSSEASASETSASETATAESSFTTLTSSTTLEGAPLTTAAASTTSSASPSETPGSLVGSGPVADLKLRGTGDRYSSLSFAASSSGRTLVFSLNNNRLQESNGDYLCIQYRLPSSPMPVVLCPYDDGFGAAPLTCQQSPEGVISCTSPIGHCEHMDTDWDTDPNSLNTCTRYNTGTWSQFYVNEGQDASFGDANGNFPSHTTISPRLAA